MILHALRHHGTHAFPTAEIALDFEKLPALIGVSGPNGAGKTTTFDLIVAALYLTMPYRPGALYHNFIADGFITLAWELDDRVYESDVRVSLDPPKVEATLRDVEAGTVLAGPLSRDYRRAVEALLGPLDVFLATAYATQNGAGAFLRAARADRKAVLSEMLALQRYPRLLEATKAKASTLDVRLTTLRAQLLAHEAKAAERPALTTQRDELVDRKTHAEHAVAEATGTVTAAREAATQAREVRAALDPFKTERPGVEREIAQLAERITATEARLTNNRGVLAREPEIRAAVARDQALTAERARLGALAPERDQLVTQLGELGRRLEGIQGQISLNQIVLGRAEEIRTAVKRDGELVEQLEALDVEIDQARTDYQVATAERSRLVLAREQAEGRVRTLVADVERLERQAGLRGDVPCEGKGRYAGCQFLADATRAAEDVQEYRGDLHVARQALDQVLVPDAPTDGTLALQGRKGALQAERRALADVVALRGDLDVSQARSETYATQLAEAERDRAVRVARRELLDASLATLPGLETEQRGLVETVALLPVLEAAAARIQELTGALERDTADRETKSRRLAELRQRLAEAPSIEARANEAQQAANAAEERHRRAQQDVQVLERDLGGVDAQLAAAVQAEQDAERVRGELGPVAEDLGDWALLTRAFGANGIPALKIDAALPEIGATATDLLRECYGESVFTIELRTQKDSADGDRKLETLDVIVSRGADPIDAALLSGGESVLVSEALSLALALYNATRSGRTIRTLLRDEVSAPLDVDRAPAYARMLRRAAKLGGFRTVLFVSHQPACLDLADAQLVVGGGTVRVA